MRRQTEYDLIDQILSPVLKEEQKSSKNPSEQLSELQRSSELALDRFLKLNNSFVRTDRPVRKRFKKSQTYTEVVTKLASGYEIPTHSILKEELTRLARRRKKGRSTVIVFANGLQSGLESKVRYQRRNALLIEALWYCLLEPLYLRDKKAEELCHKAALASCQEAIALMPNDEYVWRTKMFLIFHQNKSNWGLSSLTCLKDAKEAGPNAHQGALIALLELRTHHVYKDPEILLTLYEHFETLKRLAYQQKDGQLLYYCSELLGSYDFYIKNKGNQNQEETQCLLDKAVRRNYPEALFELAHNQEDALFKYNYSNENEALLAAKNAALAFRDFDKNARPQLEADTLRNLYYASNNSSDYKRRRQFYSNPRKTGLTSSEALACNYHTILSFRETLPLTELVDLFKAAKRHKRAHEFLQLLGEDTFLDEPSRAEIFKACLPELRNYLKNPRESKEKPKVADLAKLHFSYFCRYRPGMNKMFSELETWQAMQDFGLVEKIKSIEATVSTRSVISLESKDGVLESLDETEISYQSHLYQPWLWLNEWYEAQKFLHHDARISHACLYYQTLLNKLLLPAPACIIVYYLLSQLALLEGDKAKAQALIRAHIPPDPKLPEFILIKCGDDMTQGRNSKFKKITGDSSESTSHEIKSKETKRTDDSKNSLPVGSAAQSLSSLPVAAVESTDLEIKQKKTGSLSEVPSVVEEGKAEDITKTRELSPNPSASTTTSSFPTVSLPEATAIAPTHQPRPKSTEELIEIARTLPYQLAVICKYKAYGTKETSRITQIEFKSGYEIVEMVAIGLLQNFAASPVQDITLSENNLLILINILKKYVELADLLELQIKNLFKAAHVDAKGDPAARYARKADRIIIEALSELQKQLTKKVKEFVTQLITTAHNQTLGTLPAKQKKQKNEQEMLKDLFAITLDWPVIVLKGEVTRLNALIENENTAKDSTEAYQPEPKMEPVVSQSTQKESKESQAPVTKIKTATVRPQNAKVIKYQASIKQIRDTITKIREKNKALIEKRIAPASHQKDTTQILRAYEHSQAEEHGNSFTMVGRALVNISIVLCPLVYFIFRKQIANSNATAQCGFFNNYFFSLKTTRANVAKGLKQFNKSCSTTIAFPIEAEKKLITPKM